MLSQFMLHILPLHYSRLIVYTRAHFQAFEFFIISENRLFYLISSTHAISILSLSSLFTGSYPDQCTFSSFPCNISAANRLSYSIQLSHQVSIEQGQSILSILATPSQPDRFKFLPFFFNHSIVFISFYRSILGHKPHPNIYSNICVVSRVSSLDVYNFHNHPLNFITCLVYGLPLHHFISVIQFLSLVAHFLPFRLDMYPHSWHILCLLIFFILLQGFLLSIAVLPTTGLYSPLNSTLFPCQILEQWFSFWLKCCEATKTHQQRLSSL